MKNDKLQNKQMCLSSQHRGYVRRFSSLAYIHSGSGSLTIDHHNQWFPRPRPVYQHRFEFQIPRKFLPSV